MSCAVLVPIYGASYYRVIDIESILDVTSDVIIENLKIVQIKTNTKESLLLLYPLSDEIRTGHIQLIVSSASFVVLDLNGAIPVELIIPLPEDVEMEDSCTSNKRSAITIDNPVLCSRAFNKRPEPGKKACPTSASNCTRP